MSNPYYTRTGYPTPNAPGSSAAMRNELDLIMSGFDKLPTLTGNAFRVVAVNQFGTALVATSALQSLAITGSTINNTVIGAVTPAAGTFSSLLVSGNVVLGNAVTIGGGTINNTPVGNVTPSTGAFTTLSASSGITGNLTGNVTGNLTGNVTGNLTGNVTGNVTASSGTSTFNNVTINGTLDMNAGTGGTVTGLSAPVNNTDATTKLYVDTGLALKLDLAGGTMSGNIAMGSNRITGLGAPTDGGDAANRTYVDTQRDTRLALAGGTMTGAIAMSTNRITGMGNPINPQDAATKIYVDNAVQGLDAKGSVRVATTGNITLSGTQTIDGVLVQAGNRVLVKDQNTLAENGIYVVAAGAWARSADADTFDELVSAFTFVEEGAVNGDNGFVCTVVAGGTLGTTPIVWVQFSGAGQIDAGAGLTKSGNQLNVGTASSARIVVNADNIDLATTGIVAGTYRSITIDAYGRATAGTNPNTLAGYAITDAYTNTQTDNLLALKLNLAGGSLTGNLGMGSNRITSLGDPTNAQDAATRNYVDTGLATKLSLSGGTMTGNIAMGANRITGMADPANAQDAATKNYIDTIFGSTQSAAASASAAAASELNAFNSAAAALLSEQNAAGSASSALSSANAAAASYDSFDDRYLGPKSVAPTVDNDGDPLLIGALYFNTVTNSMQVFGSNGWTAAGSSVNGTSRRFRYIATAGQTTFTGADSNGNTLAYDAGFVDVYLNGVRLDQADFTASTGTSLVLTSGAALNDELNIVAFGTFSVATHVAKSGDTMTGQLTLPNDGLVVGTNQLVVSGGNVGIGTAAPDVKLKVQIDTEGGDALGVATATGQMLFRPDGTNGNSIRFGGSGAGANVLRFVGAGDNERVRINSAGNVGIGTSSPAEQLHITGNFRIGSSVLATPSGSAPAYLCRAWVNFDGTTTPPTIRASGNVSSVTRTGTGISFINFATAMPDANYVPMYNDWSYGLGYADTLTTTSFSVKSLLNNWALQNVAHVYISVFR